MILKSLLNRTRTLDKFHHTIVLAAGKHLVARKLEINIYIFPKAIHKREQRKYKLILAHIVTIFYNKGVFFQFG